MDAQPFVVVFSDIDGALNPSAASFSTAAAVLRQLDPARAALVLASGKTRAELESIQHRLRIRDPFIAEFGAAAFVHDGYFDFDIPQTRPAGGFQVLELGHAYESVVQRLNRVADRAGVDIVGFSEMSVADVAHELGLPLLEARLAKLREYGELFRVVSRRHRDRVRLFRALQAAQLHCLPGRLFDHVGSRPDRAFSINFLKQLFRMAHGRIVGVGITDLIHEDGLVPFVDQPLVAAPSGRDGTIDPVDWAEAIVDAVRQALQGRTLVNAC
jgi:mannosyl-3-phosphoglycerate phosphatase